MPFKDFSVLSQSLLCSIIYARRSLRGSPGLLKTTSQTQTRRSFLNNLSLSIVSELEIAGYHIHRRTNYVREMFKWESFSQADVLPNVSCPLQLLRLRTQGLSPSPAPDLKCKEWSDDCLNINLKQQPLRYILLFLQGWLVANRRELSSLHKLTNSNFHWTQKIRQRI